MTTLILTLITIALLTIFLIYLIKYIRLKKTILQFYTYNRIGIITDNDFIGNAQIHIEELERYKNNLSRVKIVKMDIFSGGDSMRENIRKYFKEVQCTSNITWLERDEDLMDVRRKKLERLI